MHEKKEPCEINVGKNELFDLHVKFCNTCEKFLSYA